VSDRHAERRTWREAGLLVIQLLGTARGHHLKDQGQRRMARRILKKINFEIEARGGEPLDLGESWSEDTIDEGLRA
jgi:hypothetical protein